MQVTSLLLQALHDCSKSDLHMYAINVNHTTTLNEQIGKCITYLYIYISDS